MLVLRIFHGRFKDLRNVWVEIIVTEDLQKGFSKVFIRKLVREAPTRQG